MSLKRGQPSLSFSDIIRTRSPLSCSSTGISSHTLMLIKSEKEIMNYLRIFSFMPTQSRKIDEILVDSKFSSTLTSHEVIVSIKLYLDVRNDEYIILTILVAIPNPSPLLSRPVARSNRRSVTSRYHDSTTSG